MTKNQFFHNGLKKVGSIDLTKLLTELIDPILEDLGSIELMQHMYSEKELLEFSKSKLIEIIKNLYKKINSPIKQTVRKARIDLLVSIALDEMKIHSNEEVTIEKLDNEISVQFGLSPKMKEQYILEVEKILEYQHGITLHVSKYLNKLKQDFDSLKIKPYPKQSNLQLFLNILKSLEGEDKQPVPSHHLIDAMIKSGKFSEDETDTYIQRILNEAKIYESRPGYYNRV